ncbi:hypothetical protein HY643_05045 [Candidatus Woesearchaeota archaeon]|nr:hypothetical protein [Candidatus Woesearchaeota archaeon]
MGLENVFGQPEKVEPEKKLEVIASEEAVIADWMAYFEKNKIGNCRGNRFKEFKLDCQKYLQSYQIKSAILQKFVSLANQKQIEDWDEKLCFGAFLSALIQTSYNQGNNDFEFEKINADFFGKFLEGKEDNLIRIKAETINGRDMLYSAKNCFLTVKNLNGRRTLWEAEGCVAEIINYRDENLGWYMKNCTVYLSNQEVLDKVREKLYRGENNRFILKRQLE